jgi:hypothetical protein
VTRSGRRTAPIIVEPDERRAVDCERGPWLSCRRPPARTVGVDEALAGIRGADAIVGSTSSGETVNPADA